LRIERVHEADPRETSWTVAAYESPVSDRLWHLTATGATPAPVIKALLTVLASDDALDTDEDLISNKSINEITRPLTDVGWQHTAQGRYLHWKPQDADVRLTLDVLAAQGPGDTLTTWTICAGQDPYRPEWAIHASNYTPASVLSHLAGELAHGIAARNRHSQPLKRTNRCTLTLPPGPPHQPPTAPRR
jgi:hypothetical protein